MKNVNQVCFETILVPVDGSHPSLHAEELVVLIAKTFNSKVTVLHTVSHDLIRLVSRPSANIPASIATELRSSLEQKGNQIISNARALYNEEKIPVETKLIEYGDPAEEILEACGEFDIIVMGGRGDGDTEEFELGSVAKKITRHSKCPVLLVKKRSPITKILVPIDGSDYSKKALNYAIELAQQQNAELTLLNVNHKPFQLFGKETAKIVSESIIKEASTLVETRGLQPESLIEYGSPAKMISKIAKDRNHDLIIMGSRGRSGIRRFLLGGVSDKVANIATTSVLIIK